MWSLSHVDRYELAWAAGFFDGEGWAARLRNTGRAGDRAMARINQAGGEEPPEVLLRFRRALGDRGSIGGPVRVANRRPMYRYVLSSAEDVKAALELLGPWLGPVKLCQLATAARVRPPAPVDVDADDVWTAWAAGLFDGEGCSALLRHRTHAGYFVPELSLTQSSKVGSPAVLVRFLRIVQVGKISGPYQQRSATMAVYRWKASARDDALRVIGQLWPFLGTVKREQAQRLVDALAAQIELPRGNPAWGNNKTSCVNGHEYATARIRPFVARKGGTEPRDSSGCLACLREYARRKREEKKRSATDDGGRSISDDATSYLLK